ncbi:glycosyltransferase [Pedobacter sp. PWIIR3]
MKIVFFAHPHFLGSRSMSRFINMLADGMSERGHHVQVWRPQPFFSKIPLIKLKKWLGYLDQYFVFPIISKIRILLIKGNPLYVFADNALGPYVPLVKNKPHVIHCHDFLAQLSALGEIAENPTSSTGKAYQKFIRRGYIKGRNFISISNKTKQDLERLLIEKPLRSEVVYNGISDDFNPIPINIARNLVSEKLGVDLSDGYILHIGGNQWYKNRIGVLAIYDAWRNQYNSALPLIFVGEKPSNILINRRSESPFKNEIYFFSGIDDEIVKYAYAGASIFVFPSLAEGFGWPIAEAMASGVIVLTTNENPMLEVAGNAALLINKMPFDLAKRSEWALKSAEVLQEGLTLEGEKKAIYLDRGFQNVSRFNLENALSKIQMIYLSIN